MSRGFLRTAAPFRTDLVFTIELGMGAALLVGMVLARRGYHRAHAWCQSAVVLLNLVLIAFIMAPSFSHQVAWEVPASLGNSYNAIAVAHGVLGTFAELLGLYILLAAETNKGRHCLSAVCERHRQWQPRILHVLLDHPREE
ncbi:MAG: hypothetical protein ABSH52_31475 [Terriglobia bacterium]|jgi:uncharacterized membrane protein YozB (DUF420 family)